MDIISTEALQSLSVVISSVLPAVNDPVLPPQVAIFPTHISQAGLGGFIGTNLDPIGDIVGRRVEARVVITALARDAGSLQTGAATIAGAFADSAALRSTGILRGRLADVGLVSQQTPPGGNIQFQKDLTFELTYEFLKIPVAADDTISTIPITIQVD
jgi:hypothetical protein